MVRRVLIAILLATVFLHCSNPLLAQREPGGSIRGIVSDPTGAPIPGVEVIAVDLQTLREGGSSKTSDDGKYELPPMPPGFYELTFTAPGFTVKSLENVQVPLTETRTLNVQLEVDLVFTPPVTIHAPSAGMKSDHILDLETLSALPAANGNFTVFLATVSPGVSVALPDNNAPGRGSQNIAVNGARPSQNDFVLNGIDANKIGTNSAMFVAVPARETIHEVQLQTSPYDSEYGRAAGGSIQTITRSGGNSFHGSVYGNFRNEAFNANDPFLKAAQNPRPTLRRHSIGALGGGPIWKDKTFFFLSAQGTREQNGASRSSVSDVLIDPGLTDDRSAEALFAVYKVSVNSVSLALLNEKLPNGKFLIPTPQPNGRYIGSEVLTYRENQFNINGDHRLGQANWLSVKFFSSDAPQFIPLLSANVPGFGAHQKQQNRLFSFRYLHTFSSSIVNEARAGFNMILTDTFGEQPVRDIDVGIRRNNAEAFPGLGLIRIGPAAAGALTIGNSGSNADIRSDASSLTIADTISISRAKHHTRAGFSAVLDRSAVTTNNQRRGQITFPDFNRFLGGNPNGSVIGDGINTRDVRLADYGFFIQDDWTLSPSLTFHLGVRYERFLPPLEKSGAISTLDFELYKPRMEMDPFGVPVGPPAEGLVQAGNVVPGLDLADIPNVGERMFKSIDNNIAPRVGFAYNPLPSSRLIVRGGWGIFYSRSSLTHISLTINTPPYYALQQITRGPVAFEDPYFPLPSQDQFPTVVTGGRLAGNVFDREMRTPYFHQYSLGVQWTFSERLLLEGSYVGTQGRNLMRSLAVNQAVLASPEQPIMNAVTGKTITTNSPDQANVAVRTPYQGVEAALQQIQSSGQSSYNSLQLRLVHRRRKGLQFNISYTYSKSIDNGSGGTGSTGDPPETSVTLGNQLDPLANRGVSAFDRTHRFVLSSVWSLPGSGLQSNALRIVLSNWQVSGIVTAMSGSPIDIVDGGAGEFYGLNALNNPLARPNWAPGADRKSAMTNVPPGYFFNPFAFTRPFVQANQPIPSSSGRAVASAPGTDIGNVGRNVLRGPAQSNVDLAVTKRFPLGEPRSIEVRVEFFNLFNQVNLSNPVSNLSAASFDNIGRIVSPGDFGKITSTSSNPRLIQLGLKFNW